MPGFFSFLRKQPQQARSRALVESVLQAAEQLLGSETEDPNGISVERIARRAGVGIGSVYDYFANGDSLWAGLLDLVTERNFQTLEARVNADDGRPYREQLVSLIDATLDVYLGHPARTRGIIVAIARLGWMKRVVSERDRFAHVLAARLQREFPHVADARARLRAEFLCDAVIGVVLGELWRDRDESARAAVREELRQLIMREVTALEQTRA